MTYSPEQPLRILSIFGTRPEAIKMAPLMLLLRRQPQLDSRICVSAQHRELLDQALSAFGVIPDFDLDLMRHKQTPVGSLSRILQGLDGVLQSFTPQLVLVHGDTTTTLGAALWAGYHQIPVGHVEAGLRSFDKTAPFPEELNRLLVAPIAALHFCPTQKNADNLRREGITKGIFITGNTAIDALHTLVRPDYAFENPQLPPLLQVDARILLTTAHRRENWGEPMEQICAALLDIANNYQDVRILFPVHPNPVVHATASGILSGHERIHLLPPLSVGDMHNLIARSHLVLTDSGGLQEEAPALGKPVLVLRDKTERTEAVESGTVMMAGMQRRRIYQLASMLLSDPKAYTRMARAVNPYGDGTACSQILKAILAWRGSLHPAGAQPSASPSVLMPPGMGNGDLRQSDAR